MLESSCLVLVEDHTIPLPRHPCPVQICLGSRHRDEPRSGQVHLPGAPPCRNPCRWRCGRTERYRRRSRAADAGPL